jgi:hypothetical protein
VGGTKCVKKRWAAHQAQGEVLGGSGWVGGWVGVGGVGMARSVLSVSVA